jgi:large subunit ribosomal protein L23
MPRRINLSLHKSLIPKLTHFPSETFLSARKAFQLQLQKQRQKKLQIQKQAQLEQLHTRKTTKSKKTKPPSIPPPSPFLVGSKQVFLPNFTITLKRNAKLEPWHAVFEVPLSFSKLDLRDYLWHLYNVQTRSIRSTVLPGVIRRKDSRGQHRIGPFQRTKARKKMIVELVKPFRFPTQLTKQELAEEYGPSGGKADCIRFRKDRDEIGRRRRRKGYGLEKFEIVARAHPKPDRIRWKKV